MTHKVFTPEVRYRPIKPPYKILGYARRMQKSPTSYEQIVKFVMNWIAANDNEIGKYLSQIRHQFCFYDRFRNKWYIADFYIPDIRLIIEVDGKQHITNKKQVKRDIERTEFLNSIGLSVERILNSAVTSNDFNDILKNILVKHIKKQSEEYYILNTSWRIQKELAQAWKKKIKRRKKRERGF